jgi:hypothetical protein
MNIKQIEEEIRAKCIEANPEIVREHTDTCDSYSDAEQKVSQHNGCKCRPLGIADILLAIRNKLPQFNQEVVLAAEEPLKIIGMWNLKETFENQTDERKRFIHSILHK